MKTCSVCKITKVLDEFSPSKNYKFGVSSRCKDCTNIYLKTWHAKNPERTKIQSKKNNKAYWKSDARKARDVRLKDERQAYLVAYAKKNAARIKKQHAEYYKTRQAEFLARTTAWRKANPARWTAIHKRWVANKKNAPVNDFTNDQWTELLTAFDFRCPFCPPDCIECRARSHDFTQDHLTPLSKQGPNTLWNIVPCCRSCNSKKSDGPVPKPVQPMLLTVAPSKPKRTNKKGSSHA